MSTRESMRRELRELAQLAEAKRNERKQDARSSGEWSYVDAVEAADSATERAAAPLTTPLATELPVRPSNTTVPPALASMHVPGGLFAIEPEHRSRGGRAAIYGGAVVAALVAVVWTGRTVVQPRVGAAENAAAVPTPPPVAPAAIPEPAQPAVAQNAPGNLGGSIAAAGDPSAGAAAPSASSATQASPHSGHGAPLHATKRRGGTPAHAVPKSAGPAAKAPSGPQSLDDLIRKSVNDGAK